jgi:hypothetical protein
MFSGVSGCAARNSSVATTIAASEVFMSLAPRPKSRPSRCVGGERVTVPLGQRSGRDDIGMTGKRYGPGSAG